MDNPHSVLVPWAERKCYLRGTLAPCRDSVANRFAKTGRVPERRACGSHRPVLLLVARHRFVVPSCPDKLLVRSLNATEAVADERLDRRREDDQLPANMGRLE